MSATPISSVNIDSAATKLADAILGNNEQDLADTLKAIATEIGVSHIAYLRLSPDKSVEINLLNAVVTYSKSWQFRYFLKQYVQYDPVISHGRNAAVPFDWASLPMDDPATKAFFADAANHNVGRHGLSIPLRNRRGVFALVSFTSDLSADEWELYKTNNLKKLQLLSALIDSAANINFKLPSFPVSGADLQWRAMLSRAWRLICATARDVPDEKRLQRELIEARDQEKERLGRELHDGLCQNLAGIAALSATLARKLAARNDPVEIAAVEITTLLQQTIGDARDLAHGLNPAGLAQMGLVPALDALAANVKALHPVTCTFKCDRRFPRLDAASEAHLYRITQEAVNNAVAHGRGKRIEISLRSRGSAGKLAYPRQWRGNSARTRRLRRHRAAYDGLPGAADRRLLASAAGGSARHDCGLRFRRAGRPLDGATSCS